MKYLQLLLYRVKRFVTPCVGVWIEIDKGNGWKQKIKSLPVWECGLKSYLFINLPNGKRVTPCVGVWIEIPILGAESIIKGVTPCVGVWIEILALVRPHVSSPSLPVWECGLKLCRMNRLHALIFVTPCVGVWIEIKTAVPSFV